MAWIWDPSAIAQGFWQGIFQLLALGVVAAFGTFIFQRVRARYTLRDELIEAINQFAITLYKPRKLYQAIIEESCDPLPQLGDPAQRTARRLDSVYRAIEELVAVTGQFRALQVKIIPLYGHDLDIFAYYMAIWRYLKEMRDHMGRSESLHFHAERPDGQDAFFLLLDAFRYRIMVQRFIWRRPGLARPAQSVLAEMRRRGDAVYAEYFPTAPLL